jgi:hypothetical protein
MSNAALSQIHTDPKLVFELAARVEPPEVIAANYDLDPDFLMELMEVPHVKKLIRDKRKELDEGGFVLAAKAKLMFEDLLADVYKKAKAPETGLGGVLEAAKFMRTIAGMDKPEQSAGEKFGITINIGSGGGSVSVDISNRPPPPENYAPTSIDIPFADEVTPPAPARGELGPVPVFLLGLMTHNNDLEYQE